MGQGKQLWEENQGRLYGGGGIEAGLWLMSSIPKGEEEGTWHPPLKELPEQVPKGWSLEALQEKLQSLAMPEEINST